MKLMSQQPVALSLHEADSKALCWTAFEKYRTAAPAETLDEAELQWVMACCAAASCRAEFFAGEDGCLSFMGSAITCWSPSAFRVLGLGYNGFPPGFTVKDAEGLVTLHSESNALRFAASSVNGGENVIYCTHKPCNACARQIYATLGENTKVHYAVEIQDYTFVEKLFKIQCHKPLAAEWVLARRAWRHTKKALTDLRGGTFSMLVQTGLKILLSRSCLLLRLYLQNEASLELVAILKGALVPEFEFKEATNTAFLFMKFWIEVAIRVSELQPQVKNICRDHLEEIEATFLQVQRRSSTLPRIEKLWVYWRFAYVIISMDITQIH